MSNENETEELRQSAIINATMMLMQLEAQLGPKLAMATVFVAVAMLLASVSNELSDVTENFTKALKADVEHFRESLTAAAAMRTRPGSWGSLN